MLPLPFRRWPCFLTVVLCQAAATLLADPPDETEPADAPALESPPAPLDSPESAGEKQAPSFLRVARDSNRRPSALETAIVRYVPASGRGELTVDLIAAVHVGDRDYYDSLNTQFEQYDVLLY